jgi:hypothetical protein
MGRVAIAVWFTVVAVTDRRVSTTGEAAVTVIASVTVARGMTTLMTGAEPTSTTAPSRVTVANEGSSAMIT